MQNKHWWQKVLDLVSDGLAKITIVLMVVALVAIVVLAVVQPELIPGLLLLAGQVLAGLSVAQLAVDGARKATGEDVSWGALSLDALGLLPGVGKLGTLADSVPALSRGVGAIRSSATAVRTLSSATRDAKDFALFSKSAGLTNAEALARGTDVRFTKDAAAETWARYAEPAGRFGVDLDFNKVSLATEDEIRYLDYRGACAVTLEGEVILGPASFVSEEQLVRTLIHEGVHLDQTARGAMVVGPSGTGALEHEAYSAEDTIWLALKGIAE